MQRYDLYHERELSSDIFFKGKVSFSYQNQAEQPYYEKAVGTNLIDDIPGMWQFDEKLR